jgi:hypothetical protein
MRTARFYFSTWDRVRRSAGVLPATLRSLLGVRRPARRQRYENREPFLDCRKDISSIRYTER